VVVASEKLSVATKLLALLPPIPVMKNWISPARELPKGA